MQHPTICCSHESLLHRKDIYRLKYGGKKARYLNINQQKIGIVLLISGKVHLRKKPITSGNEEYCTTMMEIIHQKCIAILNM